MNATDKMLALKCSLQILDNSLLVADFSCSQQLSISVFY